VYQLQNSLSPGIFFATFFIHKISHIILNPARLRKCKKIPFFIQNLRFAGSITYLHPNLKFTLSRPFFAQIEDFLNSLQLYTKNSKKSCVLPDGYQKPLMEKNNHITM